MTDAMTAENRSVVMIVRSARGRGQTDTSDANEEHKTKRYTTITYNDPCKA